MIRVFKPLLQNMYSVLFSQIASEQGGYGERRRRWCVRMPVGWRLAEPVLSGSVWLADGCREGERAAGTSSRGPAPAPPRGRTARESRRARAASGRGETQGQRRAPPCRCWHNARACAAWRRPARCHAARQGRGRERERARGSGHCAAGTGSGARA